MFKWFGRVSLAPATRVGEFAAHLKDGRIMASRCRACGAQAFPPRADCEACLSPEFEWVEISGRGVLHTFTTIVAAPTGFEADAPYTVGVVDLEEGGRALAWFGDSIAPSAIAIGMPVQLVPRIEDDTEAIHVTYAIERAGTEWFKAGVAVSAAGAEERRAVWAKR